MTQLGLNNDAKRDHNDGATSLNPAVLLLHQITSAAADVLRYFMLCLTCQDLTLKFSQGREWVIKFNSLSRAADSEVHAVHISHVIIAYTYESLSSLTQITHNLQAPINFIEKYINKEKQKREGTHWVDLSLEMATLYQFIIPLILN